MKMLFGDFNVYWLHVTLTPFTVRAASYGSSYDSGALLPEVGDVIKDFHSLDGKPITVRVTEVEPFGDGTLAFRVTVTTVKPPFWTDRVRIEVVGADGTPVLERSWVWALIADLSDLTPGIDQIKVESPTGLADGVWLATVPAEWWLRAQAEGGLTLTHHHGYTVTIPAPKATLTTA